MPEPKSKGQLALLRSIGKEIARHEAALVELRETKEKLIRRYERGKYQAEIDALKAVIVDLESI